MIKAGIYGATGYTGLELMRLLHTHPEVEIVFATSESKAGTNLNASQPQAPAIDLVSSTDADLSTVDVVFLCLPHTKSAPTAAEAVSAGVKVIDLSADLRIETADSYEQWYHVEHPNPELLPVPYGLPELNRKNLLDTDQIANPGCYPTTTLLAVAPVVRAGLLERGSTIIVDAKSGVTGAGRSPKQYTLFAELTSNFYPYKIGRSHRHIAEMEQLLKPNGIEAGQFIFSPHLLPVDRGIIATTYLKVTDVDAVYGQMQSFYEDEPLVDVLPQGELASLAHVIRTPRAVVSVAPATDDTVIVVSALDNLMKGAASQAVQNFNLMFGCPETTGLIQ